MGLEVKSFEAYGFNIEVHAGGRRVWPPSFKHFINDKMDRGELSIGEVMKTCNVSQSLVYKWRADVKRAGRNRLALGGEPFFSELVLENVKCPQQKNTDSDQIVLNGREVDILLPAKYPVDDLITVILSLEGRR